MTSTTNFMNGKSYTMTPLDSLKIVYTSMICGESQYYRPSETAYDKAGFIGYFFFPEFYNIENTTDYFEKVVDNALDYDFKGCLAFSIKLRNEFYMRLNSNYLLVRAIHHAQRVSFNAKNPKVFRETIDAISLIPTDWTTQFRLLKESNRPIPTIWKKSIADQLHRMTAYHASKYIHGSKTQGKTSDDMANLIDLVRITHPKPSPILTELIKSGKVKVSDSETTWEKLKSANKTWQEIIGQIRLPHMALLRNLRNILVEYSIREDVEEAIQELQILVEGLVNGVKNGKQFPFRYFSAYKTLAHLPDNIQSEMKKIVSDGLNRCVLESVECIPQMNGRVDCLSDNSGSSRGGIVSEYGTVNVFEIANLSAILTAYRATEGGSVWVFGDRLEEYRVSHTKPILEQLTEVNNLGHTVGGGTETGVWLFWEKFIRNKTRLDTVFIYSDMQAGKGQLFADDVHHEEMSKMDCQIDSRCIDVLKLVSLYRENVNPKTNVFSVQVAGYDNSILPDILYRGAILSGWTGKEAKLAYEMTTLWDEMERVDLERQMGNA